MSVFKVTNNMVKYEMMCKGLKLFREIKPRKLSVYHDFQLIIGQVNGQFKAKEEKRAKYQQRVKSN